MGYVERHLLPVEEILYKTRLHWILLLKPVLLVALSVVAAAVSWQLQAPAAVWYLDGAAAAAGLLWAFVHYVEMMTSEFAVTTVRLILKVGLVARYTTELLISKVESIGVTQSLTGRLLGFGDLTVTGTGGAREVFRRVRDPITFRNHVQWASIPAGQKLGSKSPPPAAG